MNAQTASASAAKTALLFGLIVIWLMATLAGLWWFQQKNVRAFVGAGDDAAYWRAEEVEQRLQPLLQALPAAQPGQVTLLHFWNPGCLCNQLSQRHFDALIHQFDASQLRILVVAPASLSNDAEAEFNRLNGSRMTLVRETVFRSNHDETQPGNQPQPQPLNLPASPAVALFGADGKLGYFGAYGFGALCTVANDDFFPNIVRSLQTGHYGPFANVAGSGCFCAWPADQTNK
ncbi:DUF6436 domain-containing protein [Thalassolituus sp. LLYu03]|uniref:DUF6436 domain-containing protein n=1 Tax=Thalassolituus sp. LLYu03 TaxID=3421656 RepID=UPI003D2E6E2B